jgi:hypothetical protein
MKLTEKARALGTRLAERNSTRKRLRGPAHLHYAIADSITMLDRSAWQRATGKAGLFLPMLTCRVLKLPCPPILRRAMR